MNIGTKIRTILLALASINLIIYTITHPTLWLCLTSISILITAWIAWYFNEDLTIEACQGTGYTRQLKQEKQDDYIGEYFFDEDDYEEGIYDEQDNL